MLDPEIQIMEEFVVIKFSLNELYFIENIVDISWDFEMTSR